MHRRFQHHSVIMLRLCYHANGLQVHTCVQWVGAPTLQHAWTAANTRHIVARRLQTRNARPFDRSHSCSCLSTMMLGRLLVHDTQYQRHQQSQHSVIYSQSQVTNHQILPHSGLDRARTPSWAFFPGAPVIGNMCLSHPLAGSGSTSATRQNVAAPLRRLANQHKRDVRTDWPSRVRHPQPACSHCCRLGRNLRRPGG